MLEQEKIMGAARSARNAYYGVRGHRAGLLSEQPAALESDPHCKHFVALGRLCLENGVNAADFVLVAANMYIGQDRKPELPQDFLNPSLLGRYAEQGHGTDRTPPEDRWKRQEYRLREVSLRYGPKFLVNNWLAQAAGLEAWFRVAWPYGDDYLMRHYGASAYAELVADPRIVRLLRKIRLSVVEELEELYGKLQGGCDDPLY